MYRKILVPTDGSDVSRTAIEHAVDLAQKYDAQIFGLYVTEIGRLEGMSLDIGAAMERLEEDGESFVEDVVAAAEEEGLEASGDTRVGKAPEEILAYAEEEDIDLIVMGTHGHGGLGRRLLGSVTESVVRLADVPVHTVHG